MTLPDGKTVGVVRQGLTADRSGFAKRLWRLRDWSMPGTALILVADGVRLRHARRALSTTDAPALFALEREAVLAGAGDRIWSLPRVSASIDLRHALERAAPGGGLPQELEPERADAPADFAVEGPGWDIPHHMLPVLLKPAEKRALDLISDWSWIALKELVGLLDVSPPRRGRTPGPHRPGAGATGPQGPHLRRRGEEPGGASPPKTPKARWSGATSPAGGPASYSGTSHRRRPRLPGRAHRAGPPPGVGGRPARPAQEGRPCRPNERRVTREAHAYTRRPQAERSPEAQRTDRCPARRGGPLEAARAAEPLPELARQGRSGSAPATCRCWSTRGERPPVASAAGCSRPWN